MCYLSLIVRIARASITLTVNTVCVDSVDNV